MDWMEESIFSSSRDPSEREGSRGFAKDETLDETLSASSCAHALSMIVTGATGPNDEIILFFNLKTIEEVMD